uniref:Lupus La protein-like n=1 Tax=Sinocyclocheilus anshuiensis TaxID=1608454 RepID=A0A671NX31_9TELE
MVDNQEMSLLEKKVAEQIEYYFGDHNLPRDKFLKEQLQLDDGWVTLETMLKFNRLKSLTSDPAVIVESLQKSKTGLLEIIPLSAPVLFVLLDTIWFADKGTVENIYLRKGAQKTFKGSIFAVLESEEAAKALVERTDVKEYKGNEMIVMMKDDYFSKKVAERKQNRVEAKAKAKSEKEDKQKQAEDEELKSLNDQRGCLLKFSGELGQISREDFHTVFSDHARIKWIDFTRGAKEGTILFHSNAQEALQKVREAKGGEDPKVKEQVVQWEVLEGDVEMETLKKIIEDQQESMNKRKGGRGGHRGRGRGRGGRRDRGGREQTQFKGKKTKFDSDEEGDEEQASPKKRPLESNGQDNEEPASKQAKSENGS